MISPKNRSRFVLTLATMAVAGGFAPAAAQSAAPEARVTVVGTGEVRAVPDMAVLTVESNITRNTPREAAQEARKGIEAALAAARKVVRDTADLRTARVSLTPEYDWRDGKRVFRGYSAGQTLEITVRDLSKLEGLLTNFTSLP